MMDVYDGVHGSALWSSSTINNSARFRLHNVYRRRRFQFAVPHTFDFNFDNIQRVSASTFILSGRYSRAKINSIKAASWIYVIIELLLKRCNRLYG
jgi:hypothetical protein